MRQFWKHESHVVWHILTILIIGFYVYLQVLPHFETRGTDIAGFAAHQNDYKHLYLGSVMLAEGLSPYDQEGIRALAYEYSLRVDPRFRTILPYVYLPFTGMVLWPLTLLPFAKSALLFQVLNHLFLIGGLVLAAKAAGWRVKERQMALLLALVAFNAVVFRQNSAGQLNAILFFGMVLMLFGMRRNWPGWLIGLIGAFLMLFKLTPGIFLIWFLLRKDWRRAGWMIGWSAVLMLFSLGLYGWRVHADFLPLLQSMGYGRSTWENLGQTFWRDPYNQSFNALFHRFLVERQGSGIDPWLSLSPKIANGLTWLVSLGILSGFSILTWRSRKEDNLVPASFGLAVCVSLLLPSIMWDHYLVQALLPAIVLLNPPMEGRGRRIIQGAALLSLVIMSIPLPLDHPVFRSGPGLLLMSVKLVPVLLLAGGTVCCLWFGRIKKTGSPSLDSP